MTQQAPIKNGSKPVWNMVIEDMYKRAQDGEKKYGTPLQAFNGRDPLVDAYEEVLDLCVYMRQAIVERDASNMAWARSGHVFEVNGRIYGNFVEACVVAEELAISGDTVVKVDGITPDGLRYPAYIIDWPGVCRSIVFTPEQETA